MAYLYFRRGFLYLLGITCLLVLLVYTRQQGLWIRTLLIKNIFPGTSRSNVSAHSADDSSKAIIGRLRAAADENASKKKKDIKEVQVMYVGSKPSFIHMPQSAHIVY
jgi:hypothetical protein